MPGARSCGRRRSAGDRSAGLTEAFPAIADALHSLTARGFVLSERCSSVIKGELRDAGVERWHGKEGGSNSHLAYGTLADLLPANAPHRVVLALRKAQMRQPLRQKVEPLQADVQKAIDSFKPDRARDAATVEVKAAHSRMEAVFAENRAMDARVAQMRATSRKLRPEHPEQASELRAALREFPKHETDHAGAAHGERRTRRGASGLRRSAGTRARATGRSRRCGAATRQRAAGEDGGGTGNAVHESAAAERIRCTRDCGDCPSRRACRATWFTLARVEIPAGNIVRIGPAGSGEHASGSPDFLLRSGHFYGVPRLRTIDRERVKRTARLSQGSAARKGADDPESDARANDHSDHGFPSRHQHQRERETNRGKREESYDKADPMS